MTKANVFMVEENSTQELSKTEIVAMLQDDIAEVVFTKKDGTERVMECTLMKDHLPEIVSKSQAKRQTVQRAPNPDTVAVFDIENDGWRSFRLDSIKSIGFPNSVIA